jgi:hypothetical protein
VEFRNAMRLRVFRKQFTEEDRETILKSFLTDLSGGLFIQRNPVMADLLLESERLGSCYTEQLGCRSLDLLHVAMALVLGAKSFAGFDHRQNRLAKAAGLQLLVE